VGNSHSGQSHYITGDQAPRLERPGDLDALSSTSRLNSTYSSILSAVSVKWKLLADDYKIAVATATDAANLKWSVWLQ
jgi:hypothetical protein